MKRFDFSKTKNIVFVNTEGEALTVSVGTIEKIPSKICILLFHGSVPVKDDICSGSGVTVELRHTKTKPCRKHCCAL